MSILNYSIFHLQGEKVPEFLQGQLCSDVKTLKENTPQLTGICNAKGRLVASPFIIVKDQQYYLALTDDMHDPLIKYWKPYLMLSRINLEQVDHKDFEFDHYFEWNYLFANKIVLIKPQTSKQLMPTSLGYEKFDALSFNKGCYVGQEILARIHFKGKVKKEVCQVNLSDAINLQINQIIYDEPNNPIGQVVLVETTEKPVATALVLASKSCEKDT